MKGENKTKESKRKKDMEIGEEDGLETKQSEKIKGGRLKKRYIGSLDGEAKKESNL